MRWALCKEFFPDEPPEGSDRRYRATFGVTSARRAPVPSESDLVRISATSARRGGLRPGCVLLPKKSLYSGRLSHQGALTTVLEHTRAAYYGENFVPQ